MSNAIEAAKKAVIIEMQCHDFGHEDGEGNFFTTGPKIELLERCAKDAAQAAITAYLGECVEPVAWRIRNKTGLRRWSLHEVQPLPDPKIWDLECYDVEPLYTRPSPDPVPGLVAALSKLLDRDERNTCQHEETHRGGFLWEICDNCGAKWADDCAGKPDWVDPPEWIEARAALSLVNGEVK